VIDELRKNARLLCFGIIHNTLRRDIAVRQLMDLCRLDAHEAVGAYNALLKVIPETRKDCGGDDVVAACTMATALLNYRAERLAQQPTQTAQSTPEATS
jgi:hypothetical protein